MRSKHLVLLERIKEEISFVRHSIEKAEQAWEKARISNDECYYDSTALNLHHMYNGMERIFEQIATNIDESIPEGRNWHRDLLIQMNLTINGVRPQVISDELFKSLDEFRSFRHVVRNIYTFQYDLNKMNNLLTQLQNSKELLFKEIELFNQFLSL